MKASTRTPIITFAWAVPLAIAVLVTCKAVEVWRAWRNRG
jgi:hypothetical protein